MNEIVALRVESELLDAIDRMIKDSKIDRSTLIRELIRVGLKEMLKERAAQMYKEGKITLSKAAKNAGVSLFEIEQYLVERGYRSDYSIEDLEKEIKLIR